MDKTHRRTLAEVERDRTRALRLYLQGRTQVQIAAEIGVTQQQMSKDLRMAMKPWRKETEAERIFLLNREVARMDLVEAEAWHEWERGKADRTKTRTAIHFGADGGPMHRAEQVNETEGRLADPEYLMVVVKVSERRARLLGLDAPTKAEVGRSLADLAREAEEFLEENANQ